MRTLIAVAAVLSLLVIPAWAQTHTVSWPCNPAHDQQSGNPPQATVTGYTVTIRGVNAGATILTVDAGKPAAPACSTPINLSSVTVSTTLEAVVTAVGPSGSEGSAASAPFTFPATQAPDPPGPQGAPSVSPF